MKKETYNYSYKSAGGQPYYRTYSFDNINKHLFSVLSLSAGYQFNLSPKISFSAEPYIKIPLNGVGYGKVKLKETGVLFTAIIRPFAKKK